MNYLCGPRSSTKTLNFQRGQTSLRHLSSKHLNPRHLLCILDNRFWKYFIDSNPPPIFYFTTPPPLSLTSFLLIPSCHISSISANFNFFQHFFSLHFICYSFVFSFLSTLHTSNTVFCCFVCFTSEQWFPLILSFFVIIIRKKLRFLLISSYAFAPVFSTPSTAVCLHLFSNTK